MSSASGSVIFDRIIAMNSLWVPSAKLETCLKSSMSPETTLNRPFPGEKTAHKPVCALSYNLLNFDLASCVPTR